jgi:hypothetical protein
VKDKYRRRQRTTKEGYPGLIVQNLGCKTVGELLSVLEPAIGEDYNLASSNCKHFASAAFNYCAETKRFDKTFM